MGLGFVRVELGFVRVGVGVRVGVWVRRPPAHLARVGVRVRVGVGRPPAHVGSCAVT